MYFIQYAGEHLEAAHVLSTVHCGTTEGRTSDVMVRIDGRDDVEDMIEMDVVIGGHGQCLCYAWRETFW
jgi:hypothetical protein